MLLALNLQLWTYGTERLALKLRLGSCGSDQVEHDTWSALPYAASVEASVAFVLYYRCIKGLDLGVWGSELRVRATASTFNVCCCHDRLV